jgi:hypothetical protein
MNKALLGIGREARFRKTLLSIIMSSSAAQTVPIEDEMVQSAKGTFEFFNHSANGTPNVIMGIRANPIV